MPKPLAAPLAAPLPAPTSVPDPSCMADFDPSSLLVEQALERIHALTAPVSGTERVAIRETLGRVLAAPHRSPIDVPAHDNSAMDGFAVRSADARGDGPTALRVLGTAWAGRPFPDPVGPGECVRIMTGAVMPSGTDAVVIQEKTESGPDDTVRFGERPRAGDNVREAGEDIPRGATVLDAGQRIGAAELGVLASLGTVEASVRRRVRVAFFSTGDELRSLGEPLPDGCIYRQQPLHAPRHAAGRSGPRSSTSAWYGTCATRSSGRFGKRPRRPTRS